MNTQNESQSNRRTNERVPVSMAVKATMGRRWFLFQASDISPDGLFMAHVLDGSAPPGPKCLLEFSLPGSATVIAARGQVIRRINNGRYELAAVRFAAIAPSHRRMIREYVHHPVPPGTSAPVFLPPPARRAA